MKDKYEADKLRGAFPRGDLREHYVVVPDAVSSVDTASGQATCHNIPACHRLTRLLVRQAESSSPLIG